MNRIVICFGLLATSLFGGAAAQDKKSPEKKPAVPKTIVVLPLGMNPGTKQTLTIRGANLDSATEVRFDDGVAEVKIVSKGKAGVPDKNPEKVGDTQIVVEVKLGEKVTESPTFVVVTPDGETKPHPLLVETQRPVIKEVEPNDGFRKPQALKAFPVVVEGSIERAKDVDVFAFAGKKGQKLRAELQAVRYGSALDPQLTLYRANSVQFDLPLKKLSGDPLIEFELPRDDEYFLVVSDALDMGSNVHVYRLIVERK